VGGGPLGGSGTGSKFIAGKTPASGTAGTPGAKGAAAESPAAPANGSPSAPAGMMAAVVADGDEDSTDSYRWDGDKDGVTFEEATKPNATVSSYAPSSPNPSCCRVSVESVVSGPTCSVTQLVDDIVLPPIFFSLC
jgi:hypothetical protein